MTLPTLLSNPARPGYALVQYYDRITTRQNGLHYKTNAQGPATDTIRWSYAPASGRKGMVESTVISIDIASAAAPAGKRELFICVFDGTQRTDINYLTTFTNTVGAAANQNQPTSATVYPGETLEGHTADASTGGTTDQDLAAIVLEFS